MRSQLSLLPRGAPFALVLMVLSLMLPQPAAQATADLSWTDDCAVTVPIDVGKAVCNEHIAIVSDPSTGELSVVISFADMSCSSPDPIWSKDVFGGYMNGDMEWTPEMYGSTARSWTAGMHPSNHTGKTVFSSISASAGKNRYSHFANYNFIRDDDFALINVPAAAARTRVASAALRC